MTFAKDGFNFDQNVTGFRYVATAKETAGSTSTAGFEVSIDNVEVNKYFSADVADSGMSAVKIDKSTKVLTAIVNMPKAYMKSQIIAAIYDADGNMVSIGYKDATGRGEGYNPTSLTLSSVPSDFDTGDYTVRLFCWDGLTLLTPIMAEYKFK